MKIKLIRTGKIAHVNGSFGARLIEQGRALLVAEQTAKAEKKPGGKKAADADGAG